MLSRVIRSKLPNLFKEFEQLPDVRKRREYSAKDLLVSVLLMFLFRQGSRNSADNTAKNLTFVENIEHVFGTKTADLDTADRFLRKLPEEELENIKHAVIERLIRDKMFARSRFLNKYYHVAVDGSGMQTFDYEPYPGCPYKEYKNGIKIWTAYVLEAKLLTPSGLSVSLATEWIENPKDENFDKQDCELKAFKRLSKRLKTRFPRLPIVLLLDGLYPKKPVFDICKANGWKFIITLKNKSLKTVQEQISDMKLFGKTQKLSRACRKNTVWTTDEFELMQNIEYQGDKFNVIQNVETVTNTENDDKVSTNFVVITNVATNLDRAMAVSDAGRLRWKIENEGFNDQKTNYDIEHKYSRTSATSAKNYYQIMQIAHIINQLTYELRQMKTLIRVRGYTVKALIKHILGMLQHADFSDKILLNSILDTKTQLRY